MLLKVYFFNFIFYVSIIFFGIVFLPSLFSREFTVKVVKLWAKTIIFFLIKTFNIKIVFDNEYIKNKLGLIIAANHQSAFDTIFFLAFIEKPIYIIKKELKFIPIYGWYASRLGNIFINREKKVESIKKLSKDVNIMINQGYNVIIFPEGTRQPKGKIGNIKPGVFLLQTILKKDIYPVFFRSGGTWPKNSFKMKKENIFVNSLKPIPYGLSKNKFKETLKGLYEKNSKEYYS